MAEQGKKRQPTGIGTVLEGLGLGASPSPNTASASVSAAEHRSFHQGTGEGKGRAGGQASTATAVAREPVDPAFARYDHGLAEFPAFRFGTRRKGSDDEPLTFADTIRGENKQLIHRRWRVFPSAKWGYGGASTQGLLFDLHQIWKTQGFRGSRICYGTLRRLFQLRHPGKNPCDTDYARLRRDLDILCGYEFDCENAFWDPESRSYGTMRAWHLFTGWYEAKRRGADVKQEELPFGFIEVSDTFARVARERGFFVTGFDSAFFHSLRPIEQRLALYLSKLFVSYDFHRRFEDDLFAALPIEGSAVFKKRQTLRDAASGLLDKGFTALDRFTLERSTASNRYVATFWRGERIKQDSPSRPPSPDRYPPAMRALLEDIVEVTHDDGSLPFWAQMTERLGEEPMRFALADLRSELRSRSGAAEPIRNPGAWLTTKLLAMAKDRGIEVVRHEREPRPPR